MSKCALIKTRAVTIQEREREEKALGMGDYSRLISDFKSKSQSKDQCTLVIWICRVRARQNSKHRLRALSLLYKTLRTNVSH